MLRGQRDREIVVDKSMCQAGIGDHQEQELPAR